MLLHGQLLQGVCKVLMWGTSTDNRACVRS